MVEESLNVTTFVGAVIGEIAGTFVRIIAGALVGAASKVLVGLGANAEDV